MRHLRIRPVSQSLSSEELSHADLTPSTGAIYGGSEHDHVVSATVIDYGDSFFEEHAAVPRNNLYDYLESNTITWVNIDGIHDVEMVTAVCNTFNLHPLTCKDILNPNLRARLEEHDTYLYCVLKMIWHDEEHGILDVEQMTIILGHNFVLTFQENPGDILDGVRERIRQGKGRIRKLKADYLFYCIIDAIVHNYPVVIEYVEETVDEIEERTEHNQTSEILFEIQRHKKLLSIFKHLIAPLREVLNELSRAEHPLVNPKTLVFFKDLQTQNRQVLEGVDALRDALTTLQEFHLAVVSHKMNEIMKVLTIFSAVFMPLTFIAGIYGMNFDHDASPLNMPELSWHFGYPLAIAIMLLTGSGMLLYFRRKKWL